MTDFKLRKRVEVEWSDSYSLDKWTPLKELREDPVDLHLARSIGYVIRDEKDALVLAGSQTSNQACCCMVIPRTAIVRIKTLGGGLK